MHASVHASGTRRRLRISSAIALALTLAACGNGRNTAETAEPASGAEAAQKNQPGAPTRHAAATADAKAFSGRITYEGEAARGDVLLAHGGKVVAIAQLDKSGAYTLRPPATFAGGELVARVREPVIGVRTRTVGARPEIVSFAFSSANAARLGGHITLPKGIVSDWVDIHLTPVLDDAPPTVILAEDTGPSLHDAFANVRVKGAQIEIRVLRGTYAVRIDRLIESPPMATNAPANLGVAKLTISSGTPDVRFGASIVPVESDVEMSVTLRVLRPEDL